MSRNGKPERNPLAANLRSARLAAGFETVSDAARHIGLPIPTAIAHEGSGSSFRRPKLEQLRRYAQAYGTTIDALEGGTILPTPAPEGRQLPHFQTMMGSPILGKAQAGQWLEVDPLGEELGVAHSPEPDTFGVLVFGDSMNRLIQDGDIVIVRPRSRVRRDIHNNEVVLVQREQGGRFELSVKTYRDGQLWPESTNPKWRHPLPMNDGDLITIVGLVVGLYRAL